MLGENFRKKDLNDCSSLKVTTSGTDVSHAKVILVKSIKRKLEKSQRYKDIAVSPSIVDSHNDSICSQLLQVYILRNIYQ